MRAYDLIELAKEGWVTQHDDVALAEAPFSSDLQNFSPNLAGALRLIKGYEREGEEVEGGTSAIVCLFGATVQDLTTGVDYDCLVYSKNGKLKLQQLGTSEADDLADGNAAYTYSMGTSASLIGAGAVSNNYWQHCVYQNKIYVFNGTTGYVIWRDTTWQIDELDAVFCTDPPPAGARIPAMFMGRMFLGLDRSLYYSEISPDTDEFPAANKLDLQSEGGNYASHAVWERDLFVFLERNIVSYPLVGDVEDLVEIDMGTGWGCVAPYTLRRCGAHGLVCLSDAGVKSYPGMANLSGLIDETLDAIRDDAQAKHRLRGAYAFYNSVDDSYNLLISSGAVYNGLYQNDMWWKYWFGTGRWMKVDAFPRCSMGAVVPHAEGGRRVLSGTYEGYLYWHSDEESAGGDTHSGTATAGAANTLTDTGASFTIAGHGLKQMPVYIVAGTGAGQRRVISINTATILTVETNWDTNPSTDSVYLVGAMRGRFETPWLHFGEPFRYKRIPELHFSLDQDAVDKYYQITVWRDFETTAFRTIRGTFRDQNCIVALDASGRHIKIRIETFTITGRPTLRAVRLYAGARNF